VIAQTITLDAARPGAEEVLPEIGPRFGDPPGPVRAPADGAYHLLVRHVDVPKHFITTTVPATGERSDANQYTRILDGYAFRLWPVPRPGDSAFEKAIWIIVGTVEFRAGQIVPGSLSDNDRQLPANSAAGHADRLAQVEEILQQSSQKPPQGVHSHLTADAAVTDRLERAHRVLSELKRDLQQSLEACLRPEGIDLLFGGLSPARALAKLPASMLLYGDPSPALDQFFRENELTVAKLEESFYNLLVADLPTDPGETLADLLHQAVLAAELTYYLVHQWPSSHLDPPDGGDTN
jgi:hypothetical protein